MSGRATSRVTPLYYRVGFGADGPFLACSKNPSKNRLCSENWQVLELTGKSQKSALSAFQKAIIGGQIKQNTPDLLQ